MSERIQLTVNGQRVNADVEPDTLLLDLLREDANCLSVREGCGVGVCGACTAEVDGTAISTCLALAARHDGARVLTVEGLPSGDPVVEAFVEEGAMQCGYCTPGFVLMVKALAARNPNPSDEQLEMVLASNTCRCGAYKEIKAAARRALAAATTAKDESTVSANGEATNVPMGGAASGVEAAATAGGGSSGAAAARPVARSSVSVRTRNGGTLAATRRGEGPPVVLLHSLAMAGAMFDPYAEKLARDFEVWTYDARGHGSSSGAGDPFTAEDLADDVADLLDGAGHAKASVLGLSMGGSSAIVFAGRHPERVERLVLCDTTANYGPNRVEAWEDRARRAVAVPREKQMEFQLDRWFSPAFIASDPAEVERMREIFIACDSHTHAAACRALGGLDAVPLLAGITSPTLVLVGEEDYATPPAMAEQLASEIPDARLRVIEGIRHMSVIERSTLWDEIAAFLADGAATA